MYFPNIILSRIDFLSCLLISGGKSAVFLPFNIKKRLLKEDLMDFDIYWQI
jgi:hypothetical protein